MTDDDMRRKDKNVAQDAGTEHGNKTEPEGDHPPGYIPDPHAEVLRSLPRLRSIKTDLDDKIFTPPPPMVSRIGGVTQGCGGVLLSILGAVMLLVAAWSGYYLWGPGLLLGGGMLLVFGTRGVWSGRINGIIVSSAVIVAAAVIGYIWQSFIQPASRLAVSLNPPLNYLGGFLEIVAMVLVLVLMITMIANVVALFFWKRLKVLSPFGLAIWGGIAIILIALVLGANYAQQQARKDWLNDHLDTYMAAADDTSLIMGSNANVTLGYNFVTLEEGDDPRLDVRLAEVEAGVEAGAAIIRLNASGDLLQEAELARMFPLDEDADDPEAEAQEAADRLARQIEVEQVFMDHMQESGVDMLIADAQYSPYLLIWSADDDADEELTWEVFADVQAWRVEHYAQTYQPAYYEIVDDPQAYGTFGDIDPTNEDDADEALELWAAQTERLIGIVHDVSPDTQIGVTISLAEGAGDFAMRYYEYVLGLDIDFIGVRFFQPAALERIEDIIDEYGHPADFGKELWILETWYGYCLAPQRSMELDATWLELSAAFAASHNISVVLASDYGCFVQEGGTLFQSLDDSDNRTPIWERWRDVIAYWQG
ncbi:MAG: hypothetical protein JXA10_08925 [Anaerolineae bacterium]|nr:hypothetical protein [Anaerolineae bacterium]